MGPVMVSRKESNCGTRPRPAHIHRRDVRTMHRPHPSDVDAAQ